MLANDNIPNKVKLNILASELAEGSIVTKVLARYLYQVIEFLYEDYIAPRDERIEQLERENLALKEQLLGAAR